MPRTLAYSFFNQSHVLLVHGATSPSDAEWSAYLADLERWLPGVVGVLVDTDGGGLTSDQRRLLNAAAARSGRTSIRTAVLSSSLLGRGIVIALNLFNPKIRVFRPEAVDQALSYVGIALDRPAVLVEVERLRQRLRG